MTKEQLRSRINAVIETLESEYYKDFSKFKAAASDPQADEEALRIWLNYLNAKLAPLQKLDAQVEAAFSAPVSASISSGSEKENDSRPSILRRIKNRIGLKE